MKSRIDIRKLTYLAMLTALVVVLQLAIAPLIGSLTGLSPALVLVPIMLGVAAMGVGGGAWLAFVFCFIVLFDPTTVPFLEFNPFLTVVLVFAKGVGSAVAAGFIFKLLSKKNKILGLAVASVSMPILNTGIFVLGCLLFFRELTGVGIYALFTSVNFVIELVINLTLVPAIHHLLEISGVLTGKSNKQTNSKVEVKVTTTVEVNVEDSNADTTEN